MKEFFKIFYIDYNFTETGNNIFDKISVEIESLDP
jgi:hypothetical protein